MTVYRAAGEAMTFEPAGSSADDWMTSTLLLQVADAVGGLSFDVKLMEPAKRIPLTPDDCVTTDELAVEVEAKQNQPSS